MKLLVLGTVLLLITAAHAAPKRNSVSKRVVQLSEEVEEPSFEEQSEEVESTEKEVEDDSGVVSGEVSSQEEYREAYISPFGIVEPKKPGEYIDLKEIGKDLAGKAKKKVKETVKKVKEKAKAKVTGFLKSLFF